MKLMAFNLFCFGVFITIFPMENLIENGVNMELLKNAIEINTWAGGPYYSLVIRH